MQCAPFNNLFILLLCVRKETQESTAKNAVMTSFTFICFTATLFQKWVVIAQVRKLVFCVLMAMNTLMEKNGN